MAVSVPVGDAGLAASLRPADLVSVLVAGLGRDGGRLRARAGRRPRRRPVCSARPAPAGARLLLALTPAEAKAYAAAVGAPTATGFVIALHR